MLKFDKILEENMTLEGFRFWKKLEEKIPNVIWEKLSSSSKKYHQDENGYVNTIGEHTFDMIYAAIKLVSIFNIEIKTKDCDLLLISVLLHDSCKYGLENPSESLHTYRNHDRLIGDLIKLKQEAFFKYFSNDEVYLLEQITRFHTGRFSTDWIKGETTWKKMDPKTLFVHFLDMASSRNLLKIPKGEIK